MIRYGLLNWEADVKIDNLGIQEVRYYIFPILSGQVYVDMICLDGGSYGP